MPKSLLLLAGFGLNRFLDIFISPEAIHSATRGYIAQLCFDDIGFLGDDIHLSELSFYLLKIAKYALSPNRSVKDGEPDDPFHNLLAVFTRHRINSKLAHIASPQPKNQN
jgi:hypothetical protein